MPRSSYIYTIRVIALQLIFFCALFSNNASSVHHRQGIASRLAQATQKINYPFIEEEIDILSEGDNDQTPEDPSPEPSEDLVIDAFNIE